MSGESTVPLRKPLQRELGEGSVENLRRPPTDEEVMDCIVSDLELRHYDVVHSEVKDHGGGDIEFQVRARKKQFKIPGS